MYDGQKPVVRMSPSVEKLMKLKLRYKYHQPQTIVQEHEIELTAAELQVRLDQQGDFDFGRVLTSQDVKEYIEGKGQFATQVKLAAKEKIIENLITRVAFEAHYDESQVRVKMPEVVVEGDDSNFKIVRASVIP